MIVIELLSCSLDQNRWQPWEYQYFITFFIFLVQKNKHAAKSAFMFILAATYIYSGIAKINPVFLHSIWQNLLLVKTFHIPLATAQHSFIHYAGYGLGISEILLGVGLLLNRTRKVASYLVIVMHVILLAVFGPRGLNYDHIIWPWNVAMIMYCIVLIRDTSGSFSFKSLTIGWNKIILILFGVLPFFGLFGKWDYFLSASFFSSRPPDMYVCIPETSAINPLQKYCQMNTTTCGVSTCMVNIRSWAFDELMVPAYPQERVYEHIKKTIQKNYPQLDATYLISEYKNNKKKPREF